jgi:uncharacterized membrane-anchored protein YjiN (DUF445 family)
LRNLAEQGVKSFAQWVFERFIQDDKIWEDMIEDILGYFQEVIPSVVGEIRKVMASTLQEEDHDLGHDLNEQTKEADTSVTDPVIVFFDPDPTLDGGEGVSEPGRR